MSENAPHPRQAPSRFGTFSLVFGIGFAILYVVCDMAALPLFTYHPGTEIGRAHV